MGKHTEVPTAPNYTNIAKQQQQLSQDAWDKNLTANRANQNNPFGSLTWAKGPDGQWTQNTTLSAGQQGIFDAQQQNQQGLANLGNTLRGNIGTGAIDFSGAPAMPTVGGYNREVIDTMNQLQAPGLMQARGSKEAQLAAMGLGTGSGRAWENEQRNIGDNENRSRLNSVLAGYNQGNTEFGQGMQAHQQGVSDILGQNQANVGKLSAIMGMQQSAGNPQFANYYQGNPYQVADLMGAAQNQYQARLDASNAHNADSAATGSTLGSLAGAGMMGLAVAGLF